MNHIETVQKIYEAFGKGDIPTILGHLSEDVDWEYGASTPDVPWLVQRRGRDQAAGFFQSLAAIDIHMFTPNAMFASGNIVVTLLDLDATVRATGSRVVEEDEVHIWHFNNQGQVSRFRHRADTYQHWKAATG